MATLENANLLWYRNWCLHVVAVCKHQFLYISIWYCGGKNYCVPLVIMVYSWLGTCQLTHCDTVRCLLYLTHYLSLMNLLNDKSDLFNDAYLLTVIFVWFISYCGVYVGRMFSITKRNVYLCCSRFRVSIDDIQRLSVSHIAH